MSGKRRYQDRYGRQARREGYAARSVYKLQEIDRRARILRRGARVLDLGAAPGSWSAYAAEQVGREGRVTAVDLQPLRAALPGSVRVLQADVGTLTPGDIGRFDVVLSDMAPSTTGHRFTDQARSFDLFMRAFQLAMDVLVDRGHFAAKIFQGPDFGAARDAVKNAFAECRIVRPSATRNESYELFIVGLSKCPAEGTPAQASRGE